jgi:hypothetical protein
MNISKHLYDFQRNLNLPVDVKPGDQGIFTYNKDTPCFAEVLEVNTLNQYPLLTIQAIQPSVTVTRRSTPEGWKDFELWLLKPTILQKVQICYPEIQFAAVAKPLPAAQGNEEMRQTEYDVWMPESLDIQAKSLHGLRAANLGKFFLSSIYNFQLHLVRHEYEERLSMRDTRKVPAVEIILPSPTTYYPSYQQCYDDFFHARWAEPHKFKADEPRWDVVHIL